MANIRSTNVIGLGSMKWQRAGQKWQPCHELMIDECPPENVSECSSLDVVFVLDITGSMTAAFANIKAQLALYADWIEANTNDYRLGLISFEDTFGTEVTMSLNNRTTFTTQLNALTLVGGGALPENSNGALGSAVANGAGTWRTTAKKLIILITDAQPGGADDVADPADETDQYAQAAAGLAADIYTSCIHVPRPGNIYVSINSVVKTILQNTAAAGGGVFVQTTGSQTSPAILRILDSACNSDGGSLAGDPYDLRTHLLCCRTAVCTLCLEFDVYGQGLQYGTAEWDGEAYVGTIAGASFRAFWDVRAKCFFFWELDGVIVYSLAQCPEDYQDGTGCRDPGGEAEVTIGSGYTAEDGTLTVSALKPKRLKRGTDGACASKFCQSANGKECTCEKLCIFVSVYEYTELQCQASGTLDWADETDCELGTETPQWAGTVACEGVSPDTLTAEVYLGKDAYDQCVVWGTLTGYNITATLEEQVVEPEQMTASWVIVDGGQQIEVSIECQTCGECVGVTVDCCANPIPRTLFADIDVTTPSPGPNPDDCSCTAGTYTLRYDEGSGLAGGQYAKWTTGIMGWPCTNPAYDGWAMEMRCLTSVWNLDVYLTLGGSVVFNSSSSSPDPASTCDPFEQLFEELEYFAGGCLPGLVPDKQTITVSE